MAIIEKDPKMVSLMLQCITAADSITFVRMSPS